MFGILLIVFMVLIILWHKIRTHHWIKRNVPGPQPWPIVGNIAAHLFGRKTIGQVMKEIYRKYEGYPFVGIFRATHPCLLVRDPEFVYKIMVTDQKAFCNNEFNIDKKNDPLFGQNLFVLRDQDWKDTRQMLNPGFTSLKMKFMYENLTQNAERLVKFIKNHPTAEDDGLETRELTKRFTLENVASAAFGIDGKCFESYTELSEFMKLANSVLEPEAFSISRILIQLNAIFPFASYFISFRIVPKEIEQKLVQIVSDVVKYRKENHVQSNDYLQFILQLAKEKGFDDTEIAAHGVTFFFDGYDSSSNVFTYLLLNLALHPKYQDKIREEIRKVEEENNDEITYDVLSEMKWLDACFYESLRISPLLDILVKKCTQPYKYSPENPDFKKLSVRLYPGDTVILPYSLLMNDEKYFENPDQFIPERMMNRDNINKATFFPFGSGARVCIGQRFGLMQIKLGAAQVIKNFQISPGSKTKLPMRLIPFSFLNEVKGGVFLKYKRIEKNLK